MTTDVLTAPDRLALRGDLLDFTAEPAWGDTGTLGVRFRADHWLLIEGGRIVGAQPGGAGAGCGVAL